MKVCIVSDSHDHIPLLDAAVSEAKSNGAEMVLHCGDVVAPSTLKCLLKHRLQVHVIHGNNTGDLYSLGQMATRPDNLIHYHGMDAGITLHDKRTNLARDVKSQIQTVFGEKVFSTVISKSVRLEESPAYKKSIFNFAPNSSGAIEYYSLSEEVIGRV